MKMKVALNLFIYFVVTYSAGISWAWAQTDITIDYEPRIVSLTGRIVNARFQHPNGKWYPFFLLKLKQPVSIRASSTEPLNVGLEGITEIHVYTEIESLSALLKQKDEKIVTLQGVIFHGHTAWHRRKLVMIVKKVVK